MGMAFGIRPSSGWIQRMGSSDPFDTWQGGRFANSIANQAYELPRSGRWMGQMDGFSCCLKFKDV